ncbi:MAG: FAD-dependent oxidoreductase, partial [Clostridium perfringens]
NLREAKNVVGLRNLEDAIKIKEEAEKVKNVVVLGAGLVGIDAIAGLAFKDLNVTLVEMGDRVLPIQLDKYASSKYEKRFEDAGVKLKLGVRAEKVLIDENKNPKALLINTGEEIPCELIIVATGVRSNVAFLKDSSIETDRFGLIINEKGETNARDVYGAGDITGRNPRWPTAGKDGILAAN